MSAAKKYAEQAYPGQDTWQRIAQMAFIAGMKYEAERSKTADQKKLEKELDDLREIKASYDRLCENPELIIDYM